ncbi:Hypothetical predicted protein [Prunus dulcis]|uniref:F-box domain-containing protein n=1 Tax=Prunus dulcis TaxID=3755 RepID=A0A5E4ENP7_PRUDU|nr:Hypothetical predicted protein [Prunus dulcis]
MARKRKLVASASCVAQGACAENAIGRFSNLPDEVAYRILSFLTFKGLTRVGAVSKRCRQFHLSVPLVSFDSSCKPHRVTNQKRVRLMSSLDRYLFYRGDNRMQVFRIRWSFFTSEPASKLSDDHFRVFTWIHNAVRWNVEELYLYFSHGETNTIALPSCIFLSQSLRSLSVKLYAMILEAPSLSFSSNLHYLQLEHVKVVDERFFRWIARSCKFIKELKLLNIRGIQKITVESSSLEYFLCRIDKFDDCFHLNISGKKLESIDISWTSYESTSIKSLTIFAPNLKNLKWEGSLKHSQNLGKFMNLEKLEILLDFWGNEVDKVCEFLGSVCCAEVLTINEETMKAKLAATCAGPSPEILTVTPKPT